MKPFDFGAQTVTAADIRAKLEEASPLIDWQVTRRTGLGGFSILANVFVASIHRPIPLQACREVTVTFAEMEDARYDWIQHVLSVVSGDFGEFIVSGGHE